MDRKQAEAEVERLHSLTPRQLMFEQVQRALDNANYYHAVETRCEYLIDAVTVLLAALKELAE